jgi:hypothetical protein
MMLQIVLNHFVCYIATAPRPISSLLTNPLKFLHPYYYKPVVSNPYTLIELLLLILNTYTLYSRQYEHEIDECYEYSFLNFPSYKLRDL